MKPMMTSEHPIMMANGTFKKAKDIIEGDSVMGMGFIPQTVSKIIPGKKDNGNPSVTLISK